MGDAELGHGFLDVEVEALEAVPVEEVAEWGVVGFELGRVLRIAGVETVEGALGGAAEEAEDTDSGGLESGDFGPEGVVVWVTEGMIVQVDGAGRIVEVDCCKVNVRYPGGVLLNGEDRTVFVVFIEGLDIVDYAVLACGCLAAVYRRHRGRVLFVLLQTPKMLFPSVDHLE